MIIIINLSTRLVGVSQTLRRSAEGATYIRQGGHHVGHRPTFYLMYTFRSYAAWPAPVNPAPSSHVFF